VASHLTTRGWPITLSHPLTLMSQKDRSSRSQFAPSDRVRAADLVD